ncbi:MAG: glycosyltransferase family 4 protein [Isosphaeraceae bacterium]|nr:glycosyltransferase family 4 protein [Isosphaeraceae bacterium]
MRVLHLVKTSVGATWALRQMRELVRLGIEVHAAIPPGGPLVSCYEASGVELHPGQFDLPVRQPWRWPALRRQLRALVSRVRPDLIHSHFVGTTLTLRLALGKRHTLPRVFQVPGPLHLEHSIFRQAELRTAGPADHWIGACRWTCQRYRACGIPEDRVFLSYYGADLESFSARRPGKLRRELGVDARTKLIGMVAYLYAPKRFLGQVRGLKGHEDFVDALALVLRREPGVLGVCIGGAWGGATAYAARVRAYAAKRLGGRLRFLGTRGDIPELYPDLNVAVHPSHTENVGGAVESLLMGVPTIATDVGGFPDLVIPGETGRLVPPRDPVRLASAILEVLGDPAGARAMAARGRSRARLLFDARARAVEIRDIYREVLDS